MSKNAKSIIQGILESCSITVGGSNPWDVQVHDDRLYGRILARGSLGLGEAYMDGWWDAESVDQFIYRLLTNDIRSKLRVDMALALSMVRGALTNNQRRRVSEVGEKHYDIGNELYENMLDDRMIYSCGYWRNAADLDEAQEHKLDLICRKIGLAPGQTVLDIGSGWGGFLKFAAERYGIRGVGLTISKQQAAYANATRGDLPVETRLLDYMEMQGKFDRIVSVGMFEHVGYKNYRAYFSKVRDLLSDDGLFLLHTIGGNISQKHGDPWFEKYIFPHGMLPSPRQISQATEGMLVMEDWHNFGADYDLTLMAWERNFVASWPKISANYDQEFYRKWRYYLLSCAAIFRARHTQLWQLVLSRDGLPGGYLSIR
jgi:cyclopropane-fatty-acyl-phospholipid synthase